MESQWHGHKAARPLVNPRLQSSPAGIHADRGRGVLSAIGSAGGQKGTKAWHSKYLTSNSVLVTVRIKEHQTLDHVDLHMISSVKSSTVLSDVAPVSVQLERLDTSSVRVGGG